MRRNPDAYYAEDITLTFANNPTVTGRASALAAISVMPNRSGRCTPTWSTYERRRRRHLRVRRYLALFYGGSEVSIKACSVFTVLDGKFIDQRIYVATPRFCALG
jgi:hypothetical protein